MVDRITPQKKDDDRAWLRDEVGVDDGGPVVCESFPQWVIEDRFILLQLVAASARD
jgi:mannitol 2-dehydrogenase